MKKRKKIVKMRGSKTHGHGAKKKYRGKGSRGGKGYAGSKKHRKTWILKYKPDHLGKKGFKRKKKEKKTINVGELEKISSSKELNLLNLGIKKVIGKGEINKPLIVRAFAFTEKAKKKIENAGGKAIEV